MKHLLFVSISFPPKSDPECLQTAKYYYYLQQHKSLGIEVLTSAVPTLFMPVDPDLKRYDVGFTHKVALKIPENKYLNYLWRKIYKEGIDWPDSKKAFHQQWKKAAREIQQKPDVIYSRSFPLSSAIMGWKLQQHYQVPWIMHLSDPWADSPIHNYSPKQYAYHKKWEAACLKAASYICFTSELTIEMYQKSHPEFKDKYLYFPNVYDDADVVANPHQFTTKIKVVYTGGLVGPRNISYLIHALDLLKQDAPELLAAFEFVFAGAMDRASEALFRQQPFDNVKHIGLLSYGEALKLQRSADYLLVIDNPIKDPKRAVFFPSKLLDYFMAQRRIFAISTLGGATQKVLDSIGAATFAHQDVEGLKNQLKEIALAFQQKNKEYFNFESLPEIYSAQYNANKLKDLIMSL